MTTKIGVIYQDPISKGFLRGLQDRLNCDAEFIEAPVAIGKIRQMTRKGAKWAWKYFFDKNGVELIVRFTDADQHRWQEIRRRELGAFPPEAESILICGVAVNNPEEWLCLDAKYLAEALGLSPADLQDKRQRTDRIKGGIARLARRDCVGTSDVVARIVREVPTDVFRRWLQDDSLKTFYQDCRSAALRLGCEKVPNELGESD